jgi:hypothetical protein
LLEAKPTPPEGAPGEADRQGGCKFKRTLASHPHPAAERSQSTLADAKQYGTDLVLRNTTTGAERTFTDVLDYTLSKDAKSLVYAVSAKNEETNGVYLAATDTETVPVSLIAGKGKYQKLTWDEDQTELAFVSDRDDQESKQAKFKVYLWERGSGGAVKEGTDRNHAAAMAATEVVSSTTAGFRKDFVVSDKATLSFSLDGARLLVRRPPDPEKSADEEIPADEKVLVDLWHWKMITSSRCKRSAPSRNAAALIAPSTWSRTRSSCNLPTRRWSRWPCRMTAAWVSAGTIALTGSRTTTIRA